MAAHTIEEEDLIATVIAAVPSKYQSIVAVQQQIQGGKLTLNHLEDAMRQLYQQSSQDKGQNSRRGDSGEKEEMVLNVFDGICYLCQKKGHKAHFCLTKQSGKNANGNGGNNGSKAHQFTGTCYNSGKQGH